MATQDHPERYRSFAAFYPFYLTEHVNRVSRRLLQLRRENPALRPVHFGRLGETTLSASDLEWYNVEGKSMSQQDWNAPNERTLQYMAASTPEHEAFNRILLIVHAVEEDVTVTLPLHPGVSSFTLLWDSSHDVLDETTIEHVPGTPLLVPGASMQLFRANA